MQVQFDEILSHLPRTQTMEQTICRERQWLNMLPATPNENGPLPKECKNQVNQRETFSPKHVKPW